MVYTYGPAIAQTESLRCMKYFQHNSVLPAVWHALGVGCQDQENGEKSANSKRSQNNKCRNHLVGQQTTMRIGYVKELGRFDYCYYS